MKNEKLEMKREDWEYFRLYRQAPFKKKYLERLEADNITQLMEKYKKS
jgi:hypothetical protein